jgi:hypothetical protein
MATEIRIILVAVLMAATFLCSCRSKESVTKETSVSQTETHLSLKDSTTHLSTFVSSDTTFSNEETTIHQVVYDTSKKESVGNCPILSVTDVNTKKHSGSKGKKEQVLTSTKVQNTKQLERQNTVDKKQNSQKVTSSIKGIDHLVRNILLLVSFLVIVSLFIRYRLNLLNFIKRLTKIYR